MYKGFISYSHADAEICKALYSALGSLSGSIRFWFDQNLTAGSQWRPEIAYHLKRSQLIVFITSRDAFRPGCFVMSHEIPYAEALWESGIAHVVSATARPTELGDVFLASTELCPDKGRTLKPNYTNEDLDDWCRAVAAIVKNLIENRKVPSGKHHEPILTQALEQAQRAVEQLLTLTMKSSLTISDISEVDLVVLAKGIRATLKSPVPDFRFEIDAIVSRTQRYSLQFERSESNKLLQTSLTQLIAALSIVQAQAMLNGYPVPPNFIPATERKLTSASEIAAYIDELTKQYQIIDIEAQFLKQHNVEFANSAASEAELKVEIGKSLAGGAEVDTVALKSINDSLREIGEGLAGQVEAEFNAGNIAAPVIEAANRLAKSISSVPTLTARNRQTSEQRDQKRNEKQVRLSDGLEAALEASLGLASERNHSVAVLEHLLLALTSERSVIDLLKACRVDIDQLREELEHYIDNELGVLVSEAEQTPAVSPSAAFQRVVQRAILHVESSSYDTVTGANVIVSLFSERESHAAYFLQEQDMTRYDAVNYISHGYSKR